SGPVQKKHLDVFVRHASRADDVHIARTLLLKISNLPIVLMTESKAMWVVLVYELPRLIRQGGQIIPKKHAEDACLSTVRKTRKAPSELRVPPSTDATEDFRAQMI